MFLPYGTDAQSPRAPIGTYSLIATNVILFFLQDSLIPESVYVLEYGDGINPIQWIGSAFGHGSPCHLIGNMIFLFSFGVAVESCMRTWRFLAIYFAAIILKAMAWDISTWILGIHSGVLGASGVIYSLMTIGILAVPNRNIKCLLTWFYCLRWTTFEVPVMIFSAFYFFWDFGYALFTNFELSTPFSHATGGIAGLVVGFVVYQFGWFESNGNDLVSLIKEARYGPKVARRTPREILADKTKAEAKSRLPRKISLLDQQLKQGGLFPALDTITDIRRASPSFQPAEKQVIRLINLATRKQENEHAMFWIDEYLKRFTAISNIVLLQKARLLVVAFSSPAQALRELRKIDRRSLSLPHQKLFRQLVAKSNQLREEMQSNGDYEVLLPDAETQNQSAPMHNTDPNAEIPPEFWLRQS